ncbi:dockerin type I domain-containing protein [Vescimonas sp.]
MRKRILSLLLALTLALSAGVFGVIPALAADSCVSVKADAVTTGEVVAGSLLEIKLSDVFEDTDGHTLTYTLTNAAQFSVQTKVKDGSLYVSEKDPGTYEPKVKATCSDGKELTATFTITVKEAPHGLDAQYNYDETPAKKVTVYVTISNDGVPIRGKDGTILCHKAITVPYFDLSRYDMPEFYRFHTANGEGEYVDENIVERPTGLHLYLYLLERYFIGLPEEECGKGKYTRSDLEGFILRDDVLYMDEETAYTADTLAALKITGSPTSLYMANFWGHDENLMYYRNHCYPYMSPGWGSTSDYILLSNGDTWDVAMYSNWSFWSSGGAFTCFGQDEYSVRPGTQMTVNTQAYGTTFEGSDFYPFSNLDVFLYNDKWEQIEQYKEAADGKSTFSFTAPTEEGTYYLVGMDPYRKIATDDSGGTNYAKIAPATAILNVSATAELERPFQSISVNGTKLNAKNISYEGIVTLGSEDNEEFKNVYEEIPKYHVIVPEGTESVDITYNEGVDIYHADATAYGYETDLAVDVVSSATIRSVTLKNSYKANSDGTQTVTTPVTRYIRNADGTAMAVTLESSSTNNFRPVALFTFEYAKADTKPDVMYGDVNGDNTIDVSDALLVCQFYLGNVAPTDAQNAAADVNGDGAVDVSDALMICQFYLGNITEFPAEKKS